ncbi:hypothetical protein [Bhargavaea changchunensis]|uniref:hypothetical protein n=1 Tax=Bhargavaea changchunensis TaxID=2134037 RepID=UPI00366F7898
MNDETQATNDETGDVNDEIARPSAGIGAGNGREWVLRNPPRVLPTLRFSRSLTS